MGKRRVRIFRPKKKKKAPSIIFYEHEINDKGNRQTCVYAQCQFSNKKSGPIWGHSDAAQRRALALLTSECDCPCKFHQAREFQGKRVESAKR